MPEELTQFLKYAENSTCENAVTEELRKLHEMVGFVKHDEEVAIRYMKFWEEKEKIRREAKIADAEARAADAEKKCAELMAIIEGRKA